MEGKNGEECTTESDDALIFTILLQFLVSFAMMAGVRPTIVSQYGGGTTTTIQYRYHTTISMCTGYEYGMVPYLGAT